MHRYDNLFAIGVNSYFAGPRAPGSVTSSLEASSINQLQEKLDGSCPSSGPGRR